MTTIREWAACAVFTLVATPAIFLALFDLQAAVASTLTLASVAAWRWFDRSSRRASLRMVRELRRGER